jgi:hypothetical protein
LSSKLFRYMDVCHIWLMADVSITTKCLFEIELIILDRIVFIFIL